MGDDGTRVVPIPGGEKLLSNIESTGRILVDDAAGVEHFRDSITKEQLIELVEGQRKIGQAMLDAVARIRRKMEKGE